ncbi:excitatory amino acid transporter 1-like isoform X1 [Neodiprion virginianus]|uniref:excitatory amino acid transporter 1-like isoform X1 n=1 Tax=Neodiprion virginianus TaxID=2961670 RepID=UPI001EE6C90E|nr:excitatory amino acid transporter 1-like isoform X1 [Neodiprion virginianus]XP_046621438.1 excitatory amino acid transporter 1-like isoform X1 [Neodiprion virginianus]
MEVASELSPLSDAEKQGRIGTGRTSYYPQTPNKRPPNRRQQTKNCLKHNALTILTVLGVVGGIILGLVLRNARSTNWPSRDIMYVNYIGELFLRMLKSLILPLIMASLISAIGSLDLSLSGKIGARAIVYYMVTTVSAVITGIILVISIHPGRGDESNIERAGVSRNVTTVDTLMDLARNMFPPNLVQACISQYRTVLKPKANDTNANILTWKIEHEYADGTNILGLVVFSTVLGITLGKMGPDGRPLLRFFEALSSAMMIITNWVIWVSPIGVLFLVSSKLLEMKSFEVIIGQLGMYFMTVLVGLFIHGFIVLPLIYFLVTRRNPFSYVSNMAQALATAFGTSSSSATLPVAIGCLEDRNGIDPRVARFVMPIGATINMDGTALYEAVAAIFIAQVRNVNLSFGQLVAVSITATAASIGAAGIPQAGLVTMVMVLDTVGLPAKDVTLIIAVDWLLDRFRTTINVMGDSLGAGIVNFLSRNELRNPSRDLQPKNGADHNTTPI